MMNWRFIDDKKYWFYIYFSINLVYIHKFVNFIIIIIKWFKSNKYYLFIQFIIIYYLQYFYYLQLFNCINKTHQGLYNILDI